MRDEREFEEMLREVLAEATAGEARDGLEGRVLARVAVGSRREVSGLGRRGIVGVGGVLALAVLAWVAGGHRDGRPATPGQGAGAAARVVDAGRREEVAEVGTGRGVDAVARVGGRRRDGGRDGRMRRGEGRDGGLADGADRAEVPALGIAELKVAPLAVTPLGLD